MGLLTKQLVQYQPHAQSEVSYILQLAGLKPESSPLRVLLRKDLCTTKSAPQPTARQKILDNLTTTKLYNSHLPLTELQLNRLWWLLRLHHSRRMSFNNLKGIRGMGLPEPMLVVKHLLRGDSAGNPKHRCLVTVAEVQAPQGQQQQQNPRASKTQQM